MKQLAKRLFDRLRRRPSHPTPGSQPNLGQLAEAWEEMAKGDPLWAILREPEKRGGKWDLDTFFKTGEQDIASLFYYVSQLGFPLRRGRALDFGCGVGRLTQALCPHFGLCCGVDIAATMIEQARRLNRYGEKCCYYLNLADDLRIFADDYFDLIYSVITLQHMEPELSTKYLREFVRVLAPGGLLVFQLPSEPNLPPPTEEQAAAPLPEGGFRVEIAVPFSRIATPPNTSKKIDVRVRNASAVEWRPAPIPGTFYDIRLGNHWLDEHGNVLIRDDGRTSLPEGLAAGNSVELELVIRTPGAPGRYILELDMLQESVAWFADRGSDTVRIPMEVRAPKEEASSPELENRNAQPPLGESFFARMEMYCVGKDDVVKVLTEGGGRVLDIREDTGAGDFWRSSRYAATK